jgi:hypothetical protein
MESIFADSDRVPKMTAAINDKLDLISTAVR